MRLQSIAPALVLGLLAAGAYAQPPAPPSAAASALGGPVQPKVAAPAPAAPAVKAGAGGGADDAFPPPSSSDPDLARAIQLAKDHGFNLDAAWYGQINPQTGARMTRPELADLATTDPKKAAMRLTRLVYAGDVGRRPEALGWGAGSGAADPSHRLTGTLTDKDGRTYDINSIGLPTGRLEVAGMAANTDGPDGSWWHGRRTSVAEGDNVRVRSSYVTDTGLVIDAPDLVLPVAGGARTVNLPGGGTLTLAVVPGQTTAAAAPPRPVP